MQREEADTVEGGEHHARERDPVQAAKRDNEIERTRTALHDLEEAQEVRITATWTLNCSSET